MQTVLLVENDAATLVARSLILRCFGYTVLEADSRGDAWRACHEHQGPVHLILTKADLDDDSAIEFITRLQLLHPQVCALFVSAESSHEFSGKQRIPCEYALLQTPFRADALADAIRGLLGANTRAVSFVA
jgi:DNA-binding NtrC family response regulator